MPAKAKFAKEMPAKPAKAKSAEEEPAKEKLAEAKPAEVEPAKAKPCEMLAEEVGATVISAAELDALAPYLIERGVDFARLMSEPSAR